MPGTTFSQHGLVRRYLTLFGGETFSKLCVMAAFAYLAHVLSPADYGIVELALGITVFFVLGVESGMGLYGARVVAASPERLPTLVPEVMVLRALLGVPAFIALSAIAIIYRSAGLGLLAINAIAILLTPFLTQWVFQGLRQMQWVAIGTAARNFTFVALVILLVRPGADLRLVAAAEVGGIVVLALVNAYFLRQRVRPSLDWNGMSTRVRRLFHDVWFMGLSDFTWACLWYSPALLLGWMWLGRTEEVAWVASSVRIVLAIHTFVFLYFFNLLPNLARELADGLDGWRAVMNRSMKISIWPATLIAVGGTLIAPLLIPAIYGPPYVAAVTTFQVAVWMIPLTWFSGHFRFSLIAAGQQRWEFAVSMATALVTVALALLLGNVYGRVGAAGALVGGGAVNLLLAVAASDRYIGRVPVWTNLLPVGIAAAAGLVAGFVCSAAAGTLLGTIAGSCVYGAVMLWKGTELTALVRERM